MALDKAWPFTDPFYALVESTGQSMRAMSSFAPEFGPPIDRPRSTARMEAWSLTFPLKTFAALTTFRQWYEGQIKFGAIRYVWRHPTDNGVTYWKIVSDYQPVFRGAEVSFLRFDAMLLPGVPWYAAYVPQPYVRLPVFVADYSGGVYGVDGARGVAADLSAVSGTFYVWQRTTGGVDSFSTVTYSGDIPLTAPSGVAWLVGFVP
jgi:hypothetical protein